jgi:hypothetical protein
VTFQSLYALGNIRDCGWNMEVRCQFTGNPPRAAPAVAQLPDRKRYAVDPAATRWFELMQRIETVAPGRNYDTAAARRSSPHQGYLLRRCRHHYTSVEVAATVVLGLTPAWAGTVMDSITGLIHSDGSALVPTITPPPVSSFLSAPLRFSLCFFG